MKKLICAILAATMLSVLLTGCASAPSTPSVPSKTVTASECYDSMFAYFVAEDSGNYTFTAKNSDSIGWAVYILDEEFPEAHRYIIHAEQPELEGTGNIELGTLPVKAGQYVYIYCSVNAFTADEPDASASLDVTIF